MASRDTYNNIAPKMNIPPAAYTGNIVPNGTDLKGYEGATALLFTGEVTDGTWTIHLEENDVATSGDAGWDDVADEDRIGDIPDPLEMGDDGKLYKIGYIGTKQYIRIRVAETVMGTAVIGCIIERGAPHTAPTPEDPNA